MEILLNGNGKDMWLSSKVCKLLTVFLHVFRAEQTKEEDEDNRVTAENKIKCEIKETVNERWTQIFFPITR